DSAVERRDLGSKEGEGPYHCINRAAGPATRHRKRAAVDVGRVRAEPVVLYRRVPVRRSARVATAIAGEGTDRRGKGVLVANDLEARGDRRRRSSRGKCDRRDGDKQDE